MGEGMILAHSWLRWALLITLVGAVLGSILGIAGNKAYGATNKRLALFTTIMADIQLLLGLVLYVGFSALTKTAMQDFGQAMATPELRFYAVEHVLAMVIGIALLHIGKVKATKAETDRSKHMKTLIFFGIALVVIMSRIPWEAGRLGF